MRIYERLHFIEMLQKDMPIDEAADLSHISLPTAYSWLELYNEGGVEGLKPNFGGGRPSKLNKDQQMELKNILVEKIDSGEKLNRNDVVKLIKDVFNVEYSSKQVGEIVDKLGFGYSKAYPFLHQTSGRC